MTINKVQLKNKVLSKMMMSSKNSDVIKKKLFQKISNDLNSYYAKFQIGCYWQSQNI